MSALDSTTTDSATIPARLATVPHTAPGVLAGLEALPAEERTALRLPLSPEASWALVRLCSDVAMLGLAGLAAGIGSKAASIAAPPVLWLAVFCALTLVICAARGTYRMRLRLQIFEELRVVVTATSLAGMAVLALREVFFPTAELAAQVLRPWAFAIVYLGLGRVALHWWQFQARRDGEALRPALIVGAGKVGRRTARMLLAHPEFGMRPIGLLDKDPLPGEDGDVSVPVVGASWDLERVVEEHGVQQVVITFSSAPHHVLLNLARRCEELGVQVAFVPRLFERVTERLTIEHLGGLPLLSARVTDPKGWQFAVKHAVDRVTALVLIALTLPVLAASALAVWISLGRPLFFRQARVGRDGRPFEMLKFRTMRPGAAAPDEQSSRLPADVSPGGVEGEDRRSRVGSFMRRSSLDELPQLFNVLKGDMSLVGPRPERPEFVDVFSQTVYRYDDRHRVKAGITGWAQVNGLRAKTSMLDRAEWDNYYIENWSLWLDFKIFVMTFLAVYTRFRIGE